MSDPAANLDPAAMTTEQVLEAAELERAHTVVAEVEAGEMALGALSWAASAASDTVEHHPDVLVNRGKLRDRKPRPPRNFLPPRNSNISGTRPRLCPPTQGPDHGMGTQRTADLVELNDSWLDQVVEVPWGPQGQPVRATRRILQEILQQQEAAQQAEAEAEAGAGAADDNELGY